MPLKHPFAISLVMVVMALVGCATPEPLVSLRPVNADVVWVAGRASVQKQQGDVRIAAAFEHQDGDTLAIRVEVENDTEERLNIGPRNVTFVTCTDRSVSSCNKARRVIDPEHVLLALDGQKSLNKASAANAMALQAPLLLLSVVGDLATVASGKASSTTGLQTAALANRMEHNAARHQSAAATISEQRRLWSNVALRRNTIFPGSGSGGLVYLPIDMTARFVWLYLRLPGEEEVHFSFEQIVTQVDE